MSAQVPKDWRIKVGGVQHTIDSYAKLVASGAVPMTAKTFLAGKLDARGHLLAAVNIQFEPDQERTQRDVSALGARELARIEQSMRDNFAASGIKLVSLSQPRKIVIHERTVITSDYRSSMATGDVFENRFIELVDGPGSMTVTATWSIKAPPGTKQACDAVVESMMAGGPRKPKIAE